jgi:hypothetical protein
MAALNMKLPFEDGGSFLLQMDPHEGRSLLEHAASNQMAMEKLQQETQAKQRVAQSVVKAANERASGLRQLLAQGYDSPQVRQEIAAAEAMAEMAAAGGSITPHDVLGAVRMPRARPRAFRERLGACDITASRGGCGPEAGRAVGEASRARSHQLHRSVGKWHARGEQTPVGAQGRDGRGEQGGR